MQSTLQAPKTEDTDLTFAHIKERFRTKHVHRMHPYLGKFIPQLVEYFLRRYFKPGDTILDPFMGSGTTLVEASVLGMNSVGIDLSEFNCTISRAKTSIANVPSLEKEIKDVITKIDQFVSSNSYKLNRFSSRSEYLNKWYSERALQELLYFRSIIPNYENQDILRVILSRAARSARQTPHYELDHPKTPVKAPYYCFKHRRMCQPVDEAAKFIIRYCYDALVRVREYQSQRKDVNVQIIHGDTREVNLDGRVDGIFTSPPYVGLIDYHEQHRYAFELFGLSDLSEKEIGALSKRNNGKSVEEYKLDMIRALSNVSRFVKPNGLIFIVVNDKNNIYPEIAAKSGLVIDNVFKRKVIRRTGLRSGEFSENVFVMKKC